MPVRPGFSETQLRIALAIAAGAAAMLLYAGQFVVSRWSMQRTLSLWDLAALRFAVAGLLCLPVVLRRGAGVAWGPLLVLSIGAGAPYTLVMYAGLSYAPAAHGAVIIPGATPVVAAALGWWWFGERPWPAKGIGLALILGGLGLVSGPGLWAGGGTWLGDVLLGAAGLLWALFTVCVRRWHADPVRVTAATWVLALPYVPAYVALGGAGRLLQAPPGEVVFQALYQGVGVAVLALVLYAWSIRELGAGRASLLMPLVPVFGVALAAPILGELPGGLQLIGMLSVAVGMALAAARRARSR